ncbi:MAG: hypothetical protein K8R69_10610, partial [Deltaproteobacteria bacterium]|nr:hypothetical protein [Deltaproteobacteria bacterium]
MVQRFRKGLWWATLIVTLIGIGVSAYLTEQHFLHLSASFTSKSFCNINSYLNCDLVLTSHYASLGTLPLAGLGLLFYLYVAGALLYARLAPESFAETLAFPGVLACLAFLLSLFLAYVSMFQLRSLCIFCTALYVVSLLLFLSLQSLIGQGGPLKLLKIVPWTKS